MWLQWGNASSCWTVRCRVMNRSWSRGVKTGCHCPSASGFRCWRMAHCSSRAFRNAERGVTRIWANTTVLPKIAMACWLAARPKSFWHVSSWQCKTAQDCCNLCTFYTIQWHVLWTSTHITQWHEEIMSQVDLFPDEQCKWVEYETGDAGRKSIHYHKLYIISSYSYIDNIRLLQGGSVYGCVWELWMLACVVKSYEWSIALYKCSPFTKCRNHNYENKIAIFIHWLM